MLSDACCVFTINSRVRPREAAPQPKSHMWRDREGVGGISYIILMVEGEEVEVVKKKYQLHKSGPRRTSQQV